MPTIEDDLRRYLDAITAQVDDAAGIGHPSERSRLPRRRWAPVAVAAAAVVAALVATVGLFIGEDGSSVVTDRPSDPADADAVKGRWERLPDELEVSDSHAGLIWTGDELIGVYPENGGDDVAVQVWNRELTEVRVGASSGMEWRAFPTVVWTGSEVLVIGGGNGPGIETLGGAYDPASDSWRYITPGPGFEPGLSDPIAQPGVWTGSEVVFWDAALAYDPETDSWHSIAASPLSTRARSAVAANESQVLVWGGCPTGITDDDCDVDGAGLSDGAIYDVGSDTWTRIPEGGPVPGAELEASWTGSEFLVVTSRNGPLDGTTRVASYDPDDDRWQQMADLPRDDWVLFDLVITDFGPVVVGGGQPAIRLDQEQGAWQELGDPPLITKGAAAAWTGSRLVVTGGRPAGSYVFASGPSDSLVDRGQEADPDHPEPTSFGVAFDLPESWSFTEAEWPVSFVDSSGAELHLDWTTDDPDAAGRAVTTRIGPATISEVEGGLRVRIDVPCTWPACRQLDVFAYRFGDGSAAEQQILDLIDGLSVSGPQLTGTLDDDRVWTVRQDFDRGLCVQVDQQSLGCDNSGPVVGRTEDSATPRVAAVDILELPEDQLGNLIYGFLPEPPFRPTDASLVRLDYADGRQRTQNVTSDPRTGLWAAPVIPGDLPSAVTYLDESGQAIETFSVYG